MNKVLSERIIEAIGVDKVPLNTIHYRVEKDSFPQEAMDREKATVLSLLVIGDVIFTADKCFKLSPERAAEQLARREAQIQELLDKKLALDLEIQALNAYKDADAAESESTEEA